MKSGRNTGSRGAESESGPDDGDVRPAKPAKSARAKSRDDRQARLPRRPDADRNADHGGRALFAQRDLHVCSFVRGRDGHHRQSPGRAYHLSPICWCSSTSYRPRTPSSCRREPKRCACSRRPGRHPARLRPALGRLLRREFDAADRRRHLPHCDARHSQGDRIRGRTEERHPGARLRGLGAGPAGAGNPPERLAALSRPIPS